MARHLTRDTERAVIVGVASGFAEYFDVDPVLVRLGFIVVALVTGVGVILYPICWVIMPLKHEGHEGDEPSDPVTSTPGDRMMQNAGAAGERIMQDLHASNRTARGRIIAGSILIFLGLIFLLDRFSWVHWLGWINWSGLWPLILVAIGIGMMIGTFGKRRV